MTGDAVGTPIVPADNRYLQVRSEQASLNRLSDVEGKKDKINDIVGRVKHMSWAIAKHGQGGLPATSISLPSHHSFSFEPSVSYFHDALTIDNVWQLLPYLYIALAHEQEPTTKKVALNFLGRYKKLSRKSHSAAGATLNPKSTYFEVFNSTR